MSAASPVTTLTRGEPTDETGTTIVFWPDPAIFETTDWDYETLSRRLQEMAFLNRDLEINLTDERPEHSTTADDAEPGSRGPCATATRAASPTSSGT